MEVLPSVPPKEVLSVPGKKYLFVYKVILKFTEPKICTRTFRNRKFLEFSRKKDSATILWKAPLNIIDILKKKKHRRRICTWPYCAVVKAKPFRQLIVCTRQKS